MDDQRVVAGVGNVIVGTKSVVLYNKNAGGSEGRNGWSASRCRSGLQERTYGPRHRWIVGTTHSHWRVRVGGSGKEVVVGVVSVLDGGGGMQRHVSDTSAISDGGESRWRAQGLGKRE